MSKPKGFWMQIAIAAGIVLIAGVAITLSAEEMMIKVLKHGDNEVEVDLDGSSETIRLEDLADGEERVFGEGEHQVMVRRDGDSLEVLLNGKEIGIGGPHCLHQAEATVLLDDDGEGGTVKKIIVLSDDIADGELVEAHVAMAKDLLVKVDGDDLDEMLIKVGDDPKMVMIDSEHHLITSDHKKRVRYRCEETGSELVIDADKATGDTYICPATGCVMEKVDEPEVRVINLKISTGDDDEDSEN